MEKFERHPVKKILFIVYILCSFSTVTAQFKADTLNYLTGVGYQSSTVKTGYPFFISVNTKHKDQNSFLSFLTYFTTVDLILSKTTTPHDSRYSWDTFSNGQKRCRDSQNGQFSKNENCEDKDETVYDFSGSFDANYGFYDSPGLIPFIGFGLKVASPFTPFLSVGLLNPPKDEVYGMLIKLQVWKNYTSVGIGLMF